MPLIVVHKILIVAAAVLAVLMAVWSGRQYALQGQAVSLVMCGAGVVVAVALVFYYRTITRRYASLQNRDR